MFTKQRNNNQNSNPNLISEKGGLKYCDKKNISKENLSNIRIIKKNLVYVIGLTKEMANKSVIKKFKLGVKKD